MLSRARSLKAQRAQLHRAARCAENLYLPWLCPAQARYQIQARYSSSGISTVRRKAKDDLTPRQGSIQRSSIPTNVRSLATAAAQDPPAEYYPPEFIAAVSNQPSREGGHDYQNLDISRGFDQISPIIINNSLTTPAHRFKTSPVTGIGGEASEIHLTLEVCLKVGKLDRASMLIQRLNDIYPAGSEHLQQAHLIYLEALVMAIIEKRSQQYLKVAEDWFQTGLAKAEFDSDPTIYRLMVKACLQYDREEKLSERVNYYMSEAQKYNMELEVLDSALFSDQDLYTITQVRPNCPN
jgi:DNA-directed RNA polymerase